MSGLNPSENSRNLTRPTFPKKITRLLWGGYFLGFLVMTSMMLLTCAKALRRFQAFPFFSAGAR